MRTTPGTVVPGAICRTTVIARESDRGAPPRSPGPHLAPGGEAPRGRRSRQGGPRADGPGLLRTRTQALPDCRPLLADPDDLTSVFQPIVDLAVATVAGYEAPARFPGTAGPDVWFAAAADTFLTVRP